MTVGSPRRTTSFTALSLVLLCGWIAFGFLVAPRLVLDAYHGRSWDFLNAIIIGQDAQSPEHYLDAWRRFHLASILALAVIPLASALASRAGERFFDRFVGHCTTETLGGIRFLVVMILLVNVLWEDVPSVSLLPPSLRVDMGLMSMLHEIPAWDSVYADHRALWVLKVLTSVTLVCAMTGLRTRWSVPCAAALALIHGGILREYSHFFHTCLLPLHLAIALSFMPCGDGLSFDRYWPNGSRRRQRFRDPATYGWCRYLCWVIVAGAYVAAGFSKLGNGGVFWWHGTHLKRIILQDALNPMHFEWGLESLLARAPIEIFTVLGLSSVAIEILYGTVLFSARARRVMPLLAIGMHLGILICQGILFYDLILLQGIYVDVSRLLPEAWHPPSADDARAKRFSLSPSLHRAWFATCFTVAWLLGVCWVVRLEKYPATAWQMYSKEQKQGAIRYWRVLAISADGRKVQAYPETWIGALADTRYRDFLRRKHQDRHLFFDSLMRVANGGKSSGPIVGFELVTYRWDCIDDPDDPDFGVLESVTTYPRDVAGNR